MASNEKKRQQKLARKAAKRKEKQRELAKAQNVSIAERMDSASRYPVLHCWIAHSIAEQGMGHVLLSREVSSLRVAVATFLIDSYCLGVKDVHAEVIPRSVYDVKYQLKMRQKMPSRDADPSEARKLVQDAVTYARELGFQPHEDYVKAAQLFGDIDANESDVEFEFGKDGKPFFIAGPHDTRERCRRILDTLTRSCGPGGFDYLIPMQGFEEFDDMEWEELEEE